MDELKKGLCVEIHMPGRPAGIIREVKADIVMVFITHIDKGVTIAPMYGNVVAVRKEYLHLIPAQAPAAPPDACPNDA